MRYVAPLVGEEIEQLRSVIETNLNHRERKRAPAILWSHKGFKLKQIATLCEVDRDTVSRWLDQWETAQLKGLADAPRSGRPSRLKEEEKKVYWFI